MTLTIALAWAGGLACASPVVADAGDLLGSTTRRFTFFDGWPRESYALDDIERYVAEGTSLACAASEDLVVYRGTHLKYAAPIRVHRAFVPRLARFEEVLTTVATRHYGRAPRRIVHGGAFNCRSVRGRGERISEHALGNALDLRGFDFGPLPRRATAPDEMPRRLRRPFRVRVREHWQPRLARDARHAAFLHALVDTLETRSDVFRGIVGPPRPRHHDHLHLDASPWRYSMYAYD